MDRNLPLEETDKKESPARQHTNLEKAMGIVEDDRPKEKTSYGIKTYQEKKNEQTLIHAYDKGLYGIEKK